MTQLNAPEGPRTEGRSGNHDQTKIDLLVEEWGARKSNRLSYGSQISRKGTRRVGVTAE